MKVKVLKPCIINGKPHKPGKKEVTVSKKDGKVLVSLGKVEDLTPVKEPLSLEMTVNVEELEAVKATITKLQEEIEEKDATIEALNAKIEELSEPAKTEGGAK